MPRFHLLSFLLLPFTVQAAPPSRADLARSVLAHFADFSPDEKQTALQGLVGRAETAEIVLEALEKGTLPRSQVSGFCARQISALGNEALNARLTKAWGRVSSKADSGAAAAEIAALKKLLTPQKLTTAKPTEGRRLFASTCGTCHQLFGAGKALGPDLTGSNRKDINYLLENIVTPNALVGADYELQIITLKDGRVLAGLVRQESAQSLTLQSLTATDEIMLTDISKREKPGISLMPEGQLAALTDIEKAALIAYLQSPTQVPAGALVPAWNKPGKLPGANEGETLRVLSVDGAAAPQGMGGFAAGKWSNGQHLWWTGGKPGAKLRLEVPAPGPGHYRAAIALTQAPDYGIVKISAAKKVAIELFNGYNPQVTDSGPLDLGTVEVTGPTFDLEFEILGKDPEAARSYMVGVDYVWLEKAGP